MSIEYSEDNKITYEWTVLLQKKNHWSNYSPFSIENLDNCEFFIRASLNDDDSLNIEVEKDNLNPAKAIIKVLVNVNKKQSIIVTDWTKPCLFSNISGITCKKPDHYHITCTVKWLGFVNDCDRKWSVVDLHTSMKDYLLAEKLSDVVIEIDGQELPAHKLILASQSPVFERMLGANMRESIENRILINDIDVDVMKKVLEFLYVGTMNHKNDLEFDLQLLAVAEKYQIETLKSWCEFKLSRRITLTSVMGIFGHANLYNAEDLCVKARKFMVDNRKEVILQDEFKEMYESAPELLYEFVIDSILK